MWVALFIFIGGIILISALLLAPGVLKTYCDQIHGELKAMGVEVGEVEKTSGKMLINSSP